MADAVIFSDIMAHLVSRVGSLLTRRRPRRRHKLTSNFTPRRRYTTVENYYDRLYRRERLRDVLR
jgi:hypothetical protein